MRFSLLFTGVVGAAVSLSACDSFVEDTDLPIDRVESDSLTQQSEIGFLATGVKEGFNDTYDALAVAADLLSDAAQFDQGVRNATFPTFGEVDRGDILFDNNTIDNVYNALNEYRFLADEILNRADAIDFTSDDEGAEAERLARYTGNLHGGISRYFLGAYFSPDPQAQTGGAPISPDRESPSAVIPTSELYNQAQQKLETALQFVADGDDGAYQTRLINTMRARIALFAGNREQAASFAANGLIEGDPAFQGQYVVGTSPNNWWSEGGRGRTQVSIDDRFFDYDQEDNRMLVETAPPASASNPGPFYRQALYQDAGDPIPFLTWQENALILAEADIFDGNSDDSEARDLINSVRASRGIAELGDEDVDQDTLLEVRDRELFTRGLRLIDQRRFGLPLANGTGFFPLTQSERNANPNL